LINFSDLQFGHLTVTFLSPPFTREDSLVFKSDVNYIVS